MLICGSPSLSDLTDVDIAMSQLDPTLFPGISSSIEGHAGFIAEHAKTAATILTETKRLISVKGATSVILVGRVSLTECLLGLLVCTRSAIHLVEHSQNWTPSSWP